MTAANRDRTPDATRRKSATARLIDDADQSLLDLVDNALNRGITIHGELVIALADVDLIYLRIAALLVAADRVSGEEKR